MKPDGQNSVISYVLFFKMVVFRPLVKGNEDSGNEIVCRAIVDRLVLCDRSLLH